MSPKRKPKANVQEILNNPVRSTKQKGVKPKREGFLGWMTYLGWSMLVWTILLSVLPAVGGVNGYEVYLPSPFLSSSPFSFFYFSNIIAMLLFAKIWLNSSYRQNISFIERTLLAGITGFFIFFVVGFDDVFLGIKFICRWLLSVVVFRMMIKIKWAQFFKLYGIGVTLPAIFALVLVVCEMCRYYMAYGVVVLYVVYWIYAIGAYLYIFYKKSKEGYNKVWLKVFLFTLLPFLFLFGVRFEPYSDYYEPYSDYYEPGVMGDPL